MVEEGGPTCPLCGGKKFVEVEMQSEYYCNSRGGGHGTGPVVVDSPNWPRKSNTTDPGHDNWNLGELTTEACSTCGFIIFRVGDVDRVELVGEEMAKAVKAERRRRAKKSAKKKAAKKKAEAEAEAEEKRKREIKKLKQKHKKELKKLEDS